MGIVDLKAVLAEIRAEIGECKIGYNKEEKKITIQIIDKSTHVHLHSELGLSNKEIFNLSSQQIGDMIKRKTLLSIEASLKDKPEEMSKYLTMYNSAALITGACILSSQTSNIIMDDEPIPPEAFIKQLPEAIEKSIEDLIENKGDASKK